MARKPEENTTPYGAHPQDSSFTFDNEPAYYPLSEYKGNDKKHPSMRMEAG